MMAFFNRGVGILMVGCMVFFISSSLSAETIEITTADGNGADLYVDLMYGYSSACKQGGLLPYAN